MTARMYDGNDAKCPGQWRRGAAPWTSEGEDRLAGDVAGSSEAER